MLEGQATDAASVLRAGPLLRTSLDSLSVLTQRGGVGLLLEREDVDELVTVSRVLMGGPAWHGGMIRTVRSGWVVVGGVGLK